MPVHKAKLMLKGNFKSSCHDYCDKLLKSKESLHKIRVCKISLLKNFYFYNWATKIVHIPVTSEYVFVAQCLSQYTFALRFIFLYSLSLLEWIFLSFFLFFFLDNIIKNWNTDKYAQICLPILPKYTFPHKTSYRCLVLDCTKLVPDSSILIVLQ